MKHRTIARHGHLAPTAGRATRLDQHQLRQQQPRDLLRYGVGGIT